MARVAAAVALDLEGADIVLGHGANVGGPLDAFLLAAEPETTLANNEATASSPVTVDSDVGIAVTDGVTTVVAGEGPVGRAYTVTVTNNGPSTATGAVWDGAFPDGQLTQGVRRGLSRWRTRRGRTRRGRQ